MIYKIILFGLMIWFIKGFEGDSKSRSFKNISRKAASVKLAHSFPRELFGRTALRFTLWNI